MSSNAPYEKFAKRTRQEAKHRREFCVVSYSAGLGQLAERESAAVAKIASGPSSQNGEPSCLDECIHGIFLDVVTPDEMSAQG